MSPWLTQQRLTPPWCFTLAVVSQALRHMSALQDAGWRVSLAGIGCSHSEETTSEPGPCRICQVPLAERSAVRSEVGGRGGGAVVCSSQRGHIKVTAVGGDLSQCRGEQSLRNEIR